MQRRHLHITSFTFLLVAASGVAQAHIPGWQNPGWYIVQGDQSGIVIEDGSFPNAAACYSALNGRKQAARHHEFDSDICVNLTQNVDGDKPNAPASDAGRPSIPPPDLPGSASGMAPHATVPESQPKPALPRFASLGSEGVTVYAGPSQQQPVRWIYMRKGWPVEIIAENGDWRNIRDYDGQTGWLEKKFLDETRTGILTGPQAQAIRPKPSRESVPLAWAEPDVLLKLRHCDAFWCEVEGPHIDGYVERTAVWGLLPSEIID